MNFSQIIATDLKTYKSLRVVWYAVFALILTANPKVSPKVHEHREFNRQGLDSHFSSENQC
jgi:hypothetical protein